MPSTPYARVSLALALLLAPLALLVDLAPTTRADQVPPGSGTYYHVGDNLWAGGMAAHAAAVDGNETTGYTMSSGSGGSNPICTASGGANVTLPLASVNADLIHISAGVIVSGSNGGDGCLSFGVTLANGGAPVLFPLTQGCGAPCTYRQDRWLNASFAANVTGVWVYTSQVCSPCGGYARSAILYEAEAYQKNATTSNPVRAMANHAAANLQCYATGAAATNFASHSYAAPQGTFYVMVPSIIPASTGHTPNPMQIFTTASSLTATFHGWSRVIPDITGTRTGAVAVWKVVTTQPGIPFFVKPAGTGNVNATDTVCAFSRVGAMYSSTLSNGYIFAPLTAWGGTSSDLWGVVYDANGYPITSAYDSDFSGTGPLFRADNMTSGTQVFTTGTAGQKATLNLATLPHAWAGNGLLIALGQSSAVQGDAAKFGVQINGRPAQAIMNGVSATNAFEYAIFYVDDVATRNGLSNENGTVGQSAYRPLAAEAYEITLGSGFDPAAPVYYGNTYGRDGHAGITCRSICGANLLAQNFVLPGNQTNAVRFHVTDENAAPLAGVRVLLTNNLTAQTTDANGNATFTNVFTDATFDLTKSGHQRLCVEYVFRNSPGTTTGTSSSGCPFIATFNATFNVVLASLQSLGLGSNGTLDVGGLGVSLAITFSGNATRIIPDKVNLTITRNAGAALWVDKVLVDTRSGTYRRVGDPEPWDADDAPTFTLLYPGLKAQTETRDAGTYLAFVTDGNGTFLASQAFCIVPAWTGAACSVTLTPGDQLKLAQDSAVAVSQQRVILAQAKQEALEEQAVFWYAAFLVFVFRDDLFGMPNFVVFVLWMVVLFVYGMTGALFAYLASFGSGMLRGR